MSDTGQLLWISSNVSRETEVIFSCSLLTRRPNFPSPFIFPRARPSAHTRRLDASKKTRASCGLISSALTVQAGKKETIKHSSRCPHQNDCCVTTNLLVPHSLSFFLSKKGLASSGEAETRSLSSGKNSSTSMSDERQFSVPLQRFNPWPVGSLDVRKLISQQANICTQFPLRSLRNSRFCARSVQTLGKSESFVLGLLGLCTYLCKSSVTMLQTALCRRENE